jgi:hydrogenase 3 maturation protease
MLPDDVIDLLEPSGEGPLLVITAGNLLRSDDGLGPAVAARVLQPREGIEIFDAGEHPETAVEKAASVHPASVVIIDAADFGGAPGEARIIPAEAVPAHTLTTHTFPLPAVAALIEQDTGAAVRFIGVQPVSVAFGEGLSPEVDDTVEEICLRLGED